MVIGLGQRRQRGGKFVTVTKVPRAIIRPASAERSSDWGRVIGARLRFERFSADSAIDRLGYSCAGAST